MGNDTPTFNFSDFSKRDQKAMRRCAKASLDVFLIRRHGRITPDLMAAGFTSAMLKTLNDVDHIVAAADIEGFPTEE